MKHLLNDLTEKEKNSIREQHTGGIKVVTENFSKLLNTKSGDVKPLVTKNPDRTIKENDEDSYSEESDAANEYASNLFHKMDNEITELMSYALSNVFEEINNIVQEYQNDFKEKYGQFATDYDELYDEEIYSLMEMNVDKLDIEILSSGVSGLILDTLMGPKNTDID
jgi:hypothetical protein